MSLHAYPEGGRDPLGPDEERMVRARALELYTADVTARRGGRSPSSAPPSAGRGVSPARDDLLGRDTQTPLAAAFSAYQVRALGAPRGASGSSYQGASASSAAAPARPPPEGQAEAHAVWRQQAAELSLLEEAAQKLRRRQELELQRIDARYEAQRVQQEDSMRRLGEAQHAAAEQRGRVDALLQQDQGLQERLTEQQDALQEATRAYQRRVAEQQLEIEQLRQQIREEEDASQVLGRQMYLHDAALRERDVGLLPALRNELRTKNAEVTDAVRRHDDELACLQRAAECTKAELQQSKVETLRFAGALEELSRSLSARDEIARQLKQDLERETLAARQAVEEVAERLRPEITRLQEQTRRSQEAQDELRARLRRQESQTEASCNERAAVISTLSRENEDLRQAVKYLMGELEEARERGRRARAREKEQRHSIAELKKNVRAVRREQEANEDAIAVVSARNKELEALHPELLAPPPAADADALVAAARHRAAEAAGVAAAAAELLAGGGDDMCVSPSRSSPVSHRPGVPGGLPPPPAGLPPPPPAAPAYPSAPGLQYRGSLS
eukprot:TRINITY_DN15417_c3_g1_i1.p1 TRINITY_DN15417_c3_g1~~TRINITY_DN15417_c3_g1_i1.p1  ORF type:complete len:586 (+),score=207.25 TRINITY_DN15417_c3_g1_i1:78-1760(+)